MDYTILTYSIYISLSVFLTIWVARTLQKNGRVFLVSSFHGNDALADSVNHLLVVGFYLVNLGFVCLYLKLTNPVESGQGVFEGLGGKLGIVLLVLGAMHFMNLFIFNRIRRNAEDRKLMVPPVLPNSLTTLPPRTAFHAAKAPETPGQPD
ncbi:MAG TPA: hypothetical protein VHM91_25125 [Verrucomicrobiales bacterium]|jgi:hypothetical protein|nr:hypothetical protein [Verrucomicrobiales bacterium]